MHAQVTCSPRCWPKQMSEREAGLGGEVEVWRIDERGASLTFNPTFPNRTLFDPLFLMHLTLYPLVS